MEAGTCACRSRSSKRSGNVTRLFLSTALIVLASLAGNGAALAWEGTGPLVMDHECTDLSKIPVEWIDSAKSLMRMYYGHASHGEQVTGGLSVIEDADPFFAFAFDYRKLPGDASAFTVNDDLGVNPALFWQTSYGMDRTRAALNENPSINISMFMWCVELNTWTVEQVEEYFDSMEVLEAEFPHVTFIYTTGNAQYQGGDGYNRWLRNEQIRAYCTASDKVLFDFADMDAWWYNPDTPGWEQGTYQYDGHAVPAQHSRYYGDEWGHTTYESCEVKGKAMWWTVAMLSGWALTSSAGPGGIPPAGPFCALDQNYPNPFNPATRIVFSLGRAGYARLDIFDAAGRLVRTLVDGALSADRHEVSWNGMDGAGCPVSSGVYFYSITSDGFRDTKKMILLR